MLKLLLCALTPFMNGNDKKPSTKNKLISGLTITAGELISKNEEELINLLKEARAKITNNALVNKIDNYLVNKTDGELTELLREAGADITNNNEKKNAQSTSHITIITDAAIKGANLGLRLSVSSLAINTIMLIPWKRLPGLSWLYGKSNIENLIEASQSMANLKYHSTSVGKYTYLYTYLRALALRDIEKVTSLSSDGERDIFQTYIINPTKNLDDAALTSYLEEKYNQMVPTPKEPKAFAAHEQKLHNAAQQQPEPQNLKAASAQAQTKPA